VFKFFFFRNAKISRTVGSSIISKILKLSKNVSFFKVSRKSKYFIILIPYNVEKISMLLKSNTIFDFCFFHFIHISKYQALKNVSFLEIF
jgi:hypothetical protein